METGISRKVRLRLELRRDLPPVLADAGQMRQVVLGLVMNAAEAVGEGTGTVRVKTGTTRVKGPLTGNVTDPLPPGEYACLEVSDTGCGMDARHDGSHIRSVLHHEVHGAGAGVAGVARHRADA